MNTIRADGLIVWSLLRVLPTYADFTGKVVKVTGSDTTTVMHDSEQVKIRLSGICTCWQIDLK